MIKCGKVNAAALESKKRRLLTAAPTFGVVIKAKRRRESANYSASFALAPRCACFIVAFSMGKAQLRPRLRILLGKQIALGPGKVTLLEALHETGSITAAAKRLKMSYMRAWTLIRTMNACFKRPLVSAKHGGPRGGGGAVLTPNGKKVLALYRRMDAQCLRAVSPAWKQAQDLLRH